MNEFLDFESIKTALVDGLQQTVDGVMEQVYKENQDAIEETVYNGYTPEVYQDTFEFMDAWDISSGEVEGADTDAHGQLYYNPGYLTVGSRESGQHASVLDGSAFTEGLADVLYKGSSGGLFGSGPWTKPRNAFKTLEKKLSKTKLRSMIESGMTSAGIPWKKSTGGITQIKTE